MLYLVIIGYCNEILWRARETILATRSLTHWQTGNVINAGTDKNRYALNFPGISYRRFLLRFCTQSGRLVLGFLLIELRNYANTLTN